MTHSTLRSRPSAGCAAEATLGRNFGNLLPGLGGGGLSGWRRRSCRVVAGTLFARRH